MMRVPASPPGWLTAAPMATLCSALGSAEDTSLTCREITHACNLGDATAWREVE